jgi:glycosyltransferase involved in cell wall biosynthesis
MKFLYITPEHVSGTLSLFKHEHERRGDECRFVTFWHSRFDFEDDICLHLPLMPNSGWVRTLQSSHKNILLAAATQSPPYWSPGSLRRLAFTFRDFLNWPYIIQLDGGLDFTRDARFIRGCVEKGAHVLSFYHGSDMRTRGIIPEVDKLTELRLTSEWDLLELDKRLDYLYLPFDTDAYLPRTRKPNNPLRICHAARNPFKGTQFVIEAVEKLKREFNIELVLMRDLSFKDALRVKEDSDIFIDQLTNEGGWGYGMSSVEALAMGLPVVTNIPPQMESRIAPHPFIQADPQSLYKVLQSLLKDTSRLISLAAKGQAWAREHHDVRRVVDQLYSHYERQGWL